jgi:cytidine deaminase
VTQTPLPAEVISRLADDAWAARSNARILGKTAVGCSALDEAGSVWSGCNVEHRFRSHDIHAEVSALSSLVTGGAQGVQAVLIAADRDRFTPCGACLDWIFELGGGGCLVLVQSHRDAAPAIYTAGELMPYYPS